MNDTLIITEEDLENIQPVAIWDPTATPGGQPQVQGKEPVEIVLLIDTSGSMGADDYKPNRLRAAQDAARAFTMRKVMQNYKDRVAVIGFGGSAQLIHPLDSNLDKVAASIDALAITHTGTMLGAALQAAQQELLNSGAKRRAIVLLSDGGDEYDSSQPVKVASAFQHIKVFTIGIGTLKGGNANLPHGQQRVTLNEDVLKQIAKVTGGDYLYAPDVPELQKIYLRLADY